MNMRRLVPVLVAAVAVAAVLVAALCLRGGQPPAIEEKVAAPAPDAERPAPAADVTEDAPEAGVDPVPAIDVSEKAPPEKPAVPRELARVFGEDGAIGRMTAVDALPDRLAPESVAALRGLLNETGGDEALRNSVANKLHRCGEEHLAADLARMAWDGREKPKWRNYCVQHLYACYEEGGDASILGTLFRAADPAETDEKMVRICAVWSLARAATPRHEGRALDEATLGRIRTIALDALREKDADPLVTEAGIQSCRQLGLTEAIPEIRRLAYDDGAKSTRVRMIAVSALGDLGDESDLSLLDRLAASAQGQVKSAAALAAKKVRARAE